MVNYVACFNRDDVEACARVRRGNLEPISRKHDDLPTFGGVDCSKRRAKPAAPARFDLDEYDRRTVACDDVDLATGQAHVASENLISCALQKDDRRVLAATTKAMAFQVSSPGKCKAAAATGANPRRCSGRGPNFASASRC